MTRPRRRAVAALLTAAALGAGVAVAGPPVVASAARMITGSSIKDGSLTGADVKDGSLTAADLSAATRQGMRGATGPQGPPGLDGADGTDGADGLDGVDGVDGADGVDGLDGAPGASGSGGTAHEVVMVTATQVRDGRTVFDLTTDDDVPAGVLVEAVRLDVDGDFATCTSGGGIDVSVGDRVVGSWLDAASLEPGYVTAEAEPVTIHAECTEIAGVLPVPSFIAAVTLRWSTPSTETTRPFS